jgi:hypothetical protein
MPQLGDATTWGCHENSHPFVQFGTAPIRNFDAGCRGRSKTIQGYSVAISQADKAMEYVSYAQHCLKIAGKISDRESRVVHREMAAEWFNLADRAAEEDATVSAANSYIRRASRG